MKKVTPPFLDDSREQNYHSGETISLFLFVAVSLLRNLVDDLFTFDLVSRCSSQVPVGAQVTKDRSTNDVERFLSLIQFENRGNWLNSGWLAHYYRIMGFESS